MDFFAKEHLGGEPCTENHRNVRSSDFNAEESQRRNKEKHGETHGVSADLLYEGFAVGRGISQSLESESLADLNPNESDISIRSIHI